MTLPTFEETWDLEEPFYSGSGVRAPEETALPVAIEGRGFVLDMSDHVSFYHRYQRSPVNLTNTQQANSSGDQAQTAPEVWRRSVETWDSGEGQNRWDRDASIPGRFHGSYRVDVWDPWKVSLLPDVDQLQSFGGGTSFLVVAGGYLVLVVGTDAWWYADLTHPPTHVTMGAPALAVTTDGAKVWILDDGGTITAWTNPVTSAPWLAVTGFDAARPLLAFCAGFLLTAAGPDLLDVTDATSHRIYLHPQPAWTWRAAVDGLNGTYLLGGIGERWNVYAMSPKADATTFDPPSIAAPLPKGEIGYALSSYLGYLLIGLSTGWRFATTDTNLKVSYGRLVTTDVPVYAFEGQDRFVWFGMNGDTAHTTAGLGRADLETFVGTLTPAVAPDLSSNALTGTVHAIATFADKRIFTVDGVGLFVQADRLAPDGWLTQGQLAFASSDTKMGLYVEAFHERLEGQLLVDVSYDDVGWQQIGQNAAHGSITTGHMGLSSTFKHAEMRYRLVRSSEDVTLGPVLTRVETRAIDVSGHASEWRLPLQLFTDEDYEGTALRRSVRDRYDLLIDLAVTRRQTSLRLYGRKYTVYMADYLDLGEKPTADGKDLQGTFVAVLREVT